MTSGSLLPGVGPEEACDTWHAACARLVVITLGSRGALASLDGLRVTVPAPAVVDVADTVGAGDSFTAGLLHRLTALGHLGSRLEGLSLEDVTQACAFAACVAAQTCSVPGANPPWRTSGAEGRRRTAPVPRLNAHARSRAMTAKGPCDPTRLPT